MGWMFTAYACHCLKSFSIFSWKETSPVSMGFPPEHEVRQVSPLFITLGTQMCLRESSSSCPSQRHGSLNAYKNHLVPHDCPLTTMDMGKGTWRELPGILASSSLEHLWVLYLVPAISRPGAGGKSIHFQINQVWHFLEEGEEEKCCCCLTVWFITWFIID